MKKIVIRFFLMAIFSMPFLPLIAAESVSSQQDRYRSKDESIKGLLEAIGSSLKRPIIVSKTAALKRISGEFILSNPEKLLDKISDILGLVWYFDGQNFYVYDGVENKNVIISLKNINYSYLQHFLEKSGLLDRRYPLKGDDVSNTFYLSGPPIYIELIKKMVVTLDQNQERRSAENVVVIPLQYSFTEDRQYKYRDNTILIPGMASVISQLLNRTTSRDISAKRKSQQSVVLPLETIKNQNPEIDALMAEKPAGVLSVRSDPNTNSLLVYGTQEQILFVQKLVMLLDKPKRHIELSVWIIDIDKHIVDQLGIDWQGSGKYGNVQVDFNGAKTATLNGNRFLASIFAMVQKKQANIIARPLILTQENIPAVLDNSQTYYTKLVGERTASLENITYGTSVNLLPRFTKKREIELILTIEDGNAIGQTAADEYSILPIINKTNISTVARVPEGKSLLIGGYSKDQVATQQQKIPLLGDIPFLGRFFRYENTTDIKTVRMFLIQPKEVRDTLKLDPKKFNRGLQKALQQNPLGDWIDLYLESELWQK